MKLNDVTYENAAGESFNITTFKYYLSNFSLIRADGQKVMAAQDYFLVSEDSTASKTITLQQLPEGQYAAVSFMIGVDSVRNFSGAQAGALDPLFGMFWTWNSGYIMAKLEGTSPVSYLPQQLLQFHIGGYRVPHTSQRIVTLQLPQELIVSNTTTPHIDVQADAYAWFSQPNLISFKQLSGFMTPGTAADSIADNYQHMFSVKDITN